MKEKEIYICVTLYHLYLTLLFIGSRQSKEQSEILLNANDKSIYQQFHILEPLLQNKGYKVRCRLRNKTKDILGLEEIENRKQYQAVRQDMCFTEDDEFVLFNFAWNLQYVYSTANLYYKKCKEAVFLEEGVLTAINPPQSNLKVLIKKITGTVVEFHKLDKLKEILVQKPDIYPDSWKSKLKQLNVKNLISDIDVQTRETILAVFLGNLLEKLKKNSAADNGIIYTQPLSEDGFISEDQKIDYFKKMVAYYSRYGEPIIKLHPRDLTDYEFEGKYTVLPAYFPSELLTLLNVHFKYAVGICTSAVLTTDADYKINTNENFLKDLKFALVPIKAH